MEYESAKQSFARESCQSFRLDSKALPDSSQTGHCDLSLWNVVWLLAASVLSLHGEVRTQQECPVRGLKNNTLPATGLSALGFSGGHEQWHISKRNSAKYFRIVSRNAAVHSRQKAQAGKEWLCPNFGHEDLSGPEGIKHRFPHELCAKICYCSWPPKCPLQDPVQPNVAWSWTAFGCCIPLSIH